MYKLFGADWSLRYGAVVFVVATILAIQIPRTRLREPADEQQQQLEREEMHTPSILLGSSAMAVLRASVGFLVFFAAFSLKDDLFALGRGRRRRATSATSSVCSSRPRSAARCAKR